MKKLLIIPFLFVGLIFMKPLHSKIKDIKYNLTREYCLEFCMYDEETNSVPCGNCLPECMGEW